MEPGSSSFFSGFWSQLTIDTRTALVGLSIFLLTVILLCLRRPRNLPPGPRGWPIVGCLPQMALSGQKPHEFLSQLATRHGDVMSFYLAGKLVVVINECATMREALGQQELSSRPVFHIADGLFPGNGVFSASGAPWIEQRRFSLTVLRGFGIGKASFEENISAEAEQLVEELKKHHGGPIDPRHPLNNALCNVICSVVLGKRFQYTDPMFRNLLVHASTLTRESGAGLLVEMLPALMAKFPVFPFVRKYLNALTNFYAHIGLLIEQHEEVSDLAQPKDFIDEFQAACRAKEKQGVQGVGVNPTNLLRMVGDLFIAGTDTTATTLRWGLLYMMAFPEVQTRIQQELDDVTGRNRFPAMSDRASLPYTEATIREIQRINTVLPLSGPHFCSENTKIKGYNIPKGAFVVPNLWHSHYNPSLWADPKDFHPERFLNDEGKLCQPEQFIPFGNGRRACLGEHLAKMELFVFFSRLLHHFTFSKPRDGRCLSFEGDLGITWSPRDYTVSVLERE